MRFHEAMQYLEEGHKVRAINWYPPEAYISRSTITYSAAHTALLHWNSEWEVVPNNLKEQTEEDILIQRIKELVEHYDEQRQFNGHRKD